MAAERNPGPAGLLTLQPETLHIMLESLPPVDVFRFTFVAHAGLRAGLAVIQQLKYCDLVLRCRPEAWMPEAGKSECLKDPNFCRRLMRDWHQCLHKSPLQVVYVECHQHLIFVEPTAQLAPPPHGVDCIPVDELSDRYLCRVAPFASDKVWWQHLQTYIFCSPGSSEEDQPEMTPDPEEPVRGCMGVPGYIGCRAPFSMPDDVAAVLALNGAWYDGGSTFDRSLQAILLLKDGRFALVSACESKGTDSSADGCNAVKCIVAGSLLALVTLGQDPTSRRVLCTRCPNWESAALRFWCM